WHRRATSLPETDSARDMHIRLIAVSDRQPAWVGDAFDEYVKRLPGQWRFRLDTIPTARRTGATGASQATEAEGLLVLKQLKPAETVILLDEAGTELTSAGLSSRLAGW